MMTLCRVTFRANEARMSLVFALHKLTFRGFSQNTHDRRLNVTTFLPSAWGAAGAGIRLGLGESFRQDKVLLPLELML